MKPGSRSPHFAYVAQTLGLTLAYVFSGKAAAWLAIPPGFSAPVWPAAGIGLGGLLVLGTRFWPGVLLGSFLVNLWTTASQPGTHSLVQCLVLPIGLGTGAALQAWWGATLIQRRVGYPHELCQPRDVGRFLLWGGPVACLTSSLWGTTSLWLLGTIALHEAARNALTWWVGDTIGVLVTTPLLLAFVGQPSTVWRPRRLTVGLPLAGMMIVAIFLLGLTRDWEKSRRKSAFEDRARRVTQSLAKSFDDYLGVLHSLNRFYAASIDVDRAEFRTFVSSCFPRYPGIHALSWNSRVRSQERGVFEAQARAEGLDGYQITELASERRVTRADARPEYVAVRYIEPEDLNRSAVGFDVASDPIRLSALSLARDSDRPVATGCVRLIQGPRRRDGILVFSPVYRHGLPHGTVDERRQNLMGFVTAIFSLDEVVAAVLVNVDSHGLDVSIVDELARGSTEPLYPQRSQAVTRAKRASDDPRDRSMASVWSEPYTMAGRSWRFNVSPDGPSQAADLDWTSWSVLAFSLTCSAMLGGFLLTVTGRSIVTERLVTERTAELTQRNAELATEIMVRELAESALRLHEQELADFFDNASVGLHIVGPEGTILRANKAELAMLGYSAPEYVGHHISEFHVNPATIREILARLGRGETLRDMPAELRAKDGETKYVLIDSSVRWEQGRFAHTRCFTRDVTARRLAEEARHRIQVLFDEMFERSPIGLAIASTTGQVVRANDVLCEMLGYSREELLLRTFQEITHPADLPRDQEHLERMLAGLDTAYQTEKRYLHANGEVVWVLLNVTYTPGRGGTSAYFFSQIQDVTARKRMEEELQEQAGQLARSNADLEQFAYVASHDLREPLRMVSSFCTLLQDRYRGKLDASGEKIIHFAVDGALRMQRLIDDLLEFSRVGRADGDHQRVDLNEVARQAVANLQASIDANQAQIHLGELPVVRGNPMRCCQLLQNLLANAIKFRRAEPPCVRVSCRQDDAGWQFRVEDNGIGIEPEYADKVFVVFQRLHGANEYPGTGIGLAIVKKIVEQHGGRIWIESAPIQGCVICFTLPKTEDVSPTIIAPLEDPLCNPQLTTV